MPSARHVALAPSSEPRLAPPKRTRGPRAVPPPSGRPVAIVTQDTADVVSMTGALLEHAVHAWSIPHKSIGQRIFVAVEDVISALRAAATQPPEAVDEFAVFRAERAARRSGR